MHHRFSTYVETATVTWISRFNYTTLCVRTTIFHVRILKKGENGREQMYLDLLERLKQNDCADDASAEASTSTSTKIRRAVLTSRRRTATTMMMIVVLTKYLRRAENENSSSIVVVAASSSSNSSSSSSSSSTSNNITKNQEKRARSYSRSTPDSRQ